VSASAAALFASLVVSTVGMGLFMYGKKLHRMPQVAGGLVLMVGPYFLPGAFSILGFGAAVVAGVWTASRAGW
jgi:hypothetical protein